ncbi:hypothetical protein IEQ34_026458 [Dendrobium chrysotoxum]|uniref:WLM domain-containing protein n=1 Tax=Dendrobium chrysotoxum TaxID=161865 RepID=A0AAV7FMD1_DENCH|nr:hypothetical protein IEQ34_026458 [Dendrobium chrysotoxum]
MEEGTINVEVIWRGTKLNVEVNTRWTLGELGKKLVELTNVRPDTLKLLVPQTNTKGSRLLAPFSADNSSVEIQETGIIKRKPVRMMGVFDDEIKEVSQNNTRPDLRIAGFEEEDNRLRQLSSYKPLASLKLPQGPYIFCDFHTLELPGIKLNPPPSKALRIMHVLACDPGIIAIMNKHHWRVGIMTELAPVGYVGISPKCVLGFNKNHGEEISLRLRTDDLKGFRKYESIKKTLLHELAHMVHSEHDAKFLALEKQLNEEAASLDWSKTRSQTLSGQKVSNHYKNDVDYFLEADDVGHRLGGGSNSFSTARASSVAAAYHRHKSSSMSSLSGFQAQNKSVQVDAVNDSLDGEHDDERLKYVRDDKNAEPDFDNALIHDGIIHESLASSSEPTMIDVDDANDLDVCMEDKSRSCEDDNDVSHGEASLSTDEPVSDKPLVGRHRKSLEVPETNDSAFTQSQISDLVKIEPEPDDYAVARLTNDVDLYAGLRNEEPDPDNGGEEVSLECGSLVQQGSISSLDVGLVKAESDLDCHMRDSDNIELQRIEEPVAAICARIQEAIMSLRSELTPHMAALVLQTLLKIIRNIIEHPDELKFRRIKKANVQFQRNVANYKAAMEVLSTVGFIEDVVVDAVGVAEAYLVLKRNDPGLLWLAKSSLEVFIS